MNLNNKSKISHHSENHVVTNNNQVDITFKNIKYTVQTPKGEKNLLKGLSGVCKSGTMNAILGSSGAGKTTLLNILCQRIQSSKNSKLEGQILANNSPYNHQNFTNFAAYVMQDDILLETMTVKECLQFAANLKTHGNAEQKSERVSQMIKSLKLERCQNTFIGGVFVKGISGGEKKRTSIGYELISDPSCIFLDEPTSGLDSFTAYSIIYLLADYAHNNHKTVVFTIHQPSTDIWNLFDKIMLLVEGRFIYQGKGGIDIINHFTKIGFSCPIKSNPSDYLMSIMHGGNEVNIKNFGKYYEGYEGHLKVKVDNEIQNSRNSDLPIKPFETSFFYQVQQIAGRQVRILKRNPILSKAKFIQSIAIAIFIGLVYLNLPDPRNHPSQRDINNRNGALFLFAVTVFMMSLNPCVLTFPSERAVFLREENSKLYTVNTYFIGKLLIDLFPSIIFPIISSLIVYWMIGLNDEEASKVLIFIGNNILLSLTGLSIGFCGGTAFSSARIAISITPLLMMPLMLFAGFYKNATDYASWIGWIQYISPFKYGLTILISNEYDYEGGLPHSPVSQLGFDTSISQSFYALIGLFLGTIFLSYILLTTLKKRVQ